MSELTKVQKWFISIYLILLSINIYYTSDLNSDRPNILNDNNVNTLIVSFKNNWVKMNGYEASTLYGIVSPFDKNNILGCTYYFPLSTNNPNKNLFKPLDTTKIPKLKEHNSINDFCFTSDLYGTCLVIQTPLFSKKEYTFYDNQNAEIIIKTNPVLLILNPILFLALPNIFLGISIFLLIKGRIDLLLLTILPGSVVYFFPYGIWFVLLLYLFIHALYRIKINASVQRYYTHLIVLLTIIPTAIIAISRYTREGSLWATPKDGINLFVIFILLLVLSIYIVSYIFTSGYSLYIFFRFPPHSITSLKVLDTEVSSNSKYQTYYVDILLNETVKITKIDVRVGIYNSMTKNESLNITKYKTDGKGNYIFY